MLEVQKQLLEYRKLFNGQDLPDGHSQEFAMLETDLGITANFHPTDDRVILNYSQINSPKKDPVVRECRGLVLNKNDYSVIAKSFNRFYNLGEDKETDDVFDWGSCVTTEKLDGSLILVYFYNGEWRVNTRNSYGDGFINDSTVTWKDLVFSLLDTSKLYKEIMYTFELCSPYNKIVRLHKESKLYLLSAFEEWDEIAEYDYGSVNFHAKKLGLNMVQFYPFTSLESVKSHIEYKEKTDKTFEGFVVRDYRNNRIKIKSSSYVALHHLRGEGNNLFSPKYLLPIVMTGEIDEVIEYFPEVKDGLFKVRDKFEKEKNGLLELWDQVKGIESQKEFALSIKDKGPLTPLLFQARKLKVEPETLLKDYTDFILKALYK